MCNASTRSPATGRRPDRQPQDGCWVSHPFARLEQQGAVDVFEALFQVPVELSYVGMIAGQGLDLVPPDRIRGPCTWGRREDAWRDGLAISFPHRALPCPRPEPVRCPVQPDWGPCEIIGSSTSAARAANSMSILVTSFATHCLSSVESKGPCYHT